MTTTAGNIAEFTAVDRAPDASWFVRFMDTANALPGYATMRQALVSALGDLRGRSVLDVGCGTGDDARELAELVGPQGQVTGIDLSQAMVDEATRRNAGCPWPVEFRVADVTRLDIQDSSFDAVRAKLVLMHCEDLDTIASHLVRVLRPGGRLAIFDYDFDTTVVDHPDRDATREIVRCSSDGHPGNWSGRQLYRRFLDLGMREVTSTPLTVEMPYSFFRVAIGGRLATAQQQGALRMSAADLEAWWEPLRAADERGRFFASLTGFVLGATR